MNAFSGINRTYAVILLFFLIYLGYFFLIPQYGFWVRDSGNKFILLKQCGEKEQNSNYLSYPGKIIDEKCEFFPIPPPFAVKDKGGFKSQYNVMFFRLSSYLYKLFGFRGLYLLPFLSSFFIATIIFMLSPDNRGSMGIIKACLCFMGTPLLFYGFVFWEHSISVFLFFSGCMLFLNKKKTRYRILSSLILAVSVLLREEALLAAIAFYIAVDFTDGKQSKSVIWQRFLYFLPVLFMYLIVLKDSLLHYFVNLNISSGKNYFLLEKGKVFYNLILAAGFQNSALNYLLPSLIGLLIFLRLISNKKYKVFDFAFVLLIFLYIGSFFKAERLDFKILYGNGILYTWPLVFLIFIIPFKKLNFKKHSILNTRRFIFVYVFLVLASCPLISSYGFHWSARMLLFLCPFFTLHVLKNLPCDKVYVKRFFSVLILLTVILQIISLNILFMRKKQNSLLTSKIQSFENVPVISTVPWLAEDLAYIYHERLIFFAPTLDKALKVKQLLHKTGFKEFLLVEEKTEKNEPVENYDKKFTMYYYNIEKGMIS